MKLFNNGNYRETASVNINESPQRTRPAPQRIRRRIFGPTVFAACMVMQLLLTTLVMPWVYETLFGNLILESFGLLGGGIAGLIGALLYPSVLSPRKRLASHAWWEYPLALLASAGFSILFCSEMQCVKCMVEIPQLLPIIICLSVIYAIIFD